MNELMELLEFVFQDEYYYMGSLLILLVLIYNPLSFLFRCWNRYLRSKNIRSVGWPPAHCDADGDLQAIETEEE